MKRAAVAVSLGEDKAFLSLGQIKKSHLYSIGTLDINLLCKEEDSFIRLRENLELIDQRVKEVEKDKIIRIDRIYFELPWGLENEKVVEDTVPLKRRKKITFSDIAFLKRYIEEKFLEWDDYCLHNVVLKYEVGGKVYKNPPLGAVGKKVKLRCLLFWIKDNRHKELEDMFYNVERSLGKVICSKMSMLAASFADKDKTQAVTSLNYRESYFVVRRKDNVIYGERSDFGLEKLIQAISRQFGLTAGLAEELFYRYASFKAVPSYKEITVKKEDTYMNISIQALNLFIKRYLRDEISVLFHKIAEKSDDREFLISFLGQFNSKDGFFSFLKNIIPCTIKSPLFAPNSSAFGTMNYAINPFLEVDYLRNETLLMKVINVYREYF
ncbi:MAG: hypothetical protein GF375_03460 [Candidatus Omnitrophica bacterium]|nr:hypothetical protein [Candidatus Omnitrophota bacterium]MBD3269132.1 hypothetical protein [Candidatus Omnitrophota bacterium]